MKTRFFVASAGVPSWKIHRDVLLVLERALGGSTFGEFIPELVTTSYLGPDPDALTVSVLGTNGSASNYSSRMTLSASCIFLLLMMLIIMILQQL